MTQRKIPSYPKKSNHKADLNTRTQRAPQPSLCRSQPLLYLPVEQSTSAEWPLGLTPPPPGFRWFTPSCSPAQSPYGNIHTPAVSPCGDTGRVTAKVRAWKGQQSKKIANSLQLHWPEDTNFIPFFIFLL